MMNGVIRQSSTGPWGGTLRVVILAPRQPLPRPVEELLEAGLGEGHDFLDSVAQNWRRSDGPYHDPRALMLVVFAGEDAIAIAGVTIDERAGDPDTGRLRHIYVRPSYRRRAIGDAMVRVCLERTGASFRRLRLRAATVEAGRLYERHGFVHHPGEPDFTHLRETSARSSVPTPRSPAP